MLDDQICDFKNLKKNYASKNGYIHRKLIIIQSYIHDFESNSIVRMFTYCLTLTYFNIIKCLYYNILYY